MDFKKYIFPGRYQKAIQQEESDRRILENLQKFRYLTPGEISKRLSQLQKEWDIEKTLKMNASALALAGFILKRISRRRTFWLTGAIAGLVWHHGIRKWITRLPMMRHMGQRTREEINDEIFSLKILRGDFDHITGASSPANIIRALRT
jgi:hypothetical protein